MVAFLMSLWKPPATFFSHLRRNAIRMDREILDILDMYMKPIII